MKHLKTYNESIGSEIQDIKDICIELEDEHFNVEVSLKNIKGHRS